MRGPAARSSALLAGLLALATVAPAEETTDVGIAHAVLVSGQVPSGQVGHLQYADELLHPDSWSNYEESVVATDELYQAWFFAASNTVNKYFRMVRRDAGPADFAELFVGAFEDNLSPSSMDAITHVQTSLTQYIVFNPITEVKGFNVTYTGFDAHGATQNLSGLLVTPTPTDRTNALPMLVFQHPTQVQRYGSPSFLSIRDDEFAWIFSYLIGSTGYIVIMADYPGLGVNLDTHPYCHVSLADSVIGFIAAATNILPYKTTNVTWNGHLYMMGYSEGGYATMVSAKSIETEHPGEYDLRGVACLDGPYSLSDTMRHVMLTAGTNYDSPYFLPYVVAGYESVYTGLAEFVFTRCIPGSIPADPDFAQHLKKLMNGNYTGADITRQMKLVTPYEGPRSILTGEFLADLSNTASLVCQTLWSNDSFRAWIPTNFPLKMFHNVIDDLVPFGNMTNAYGGFIAQGAATNRVLKEEYILFIPGMGSIHVGSFPVATVLGYLWIDGIENPDRH